jgi:hypothetical protein
VIDTVHFVQKGAQDASFGGGASGHTHAIVCSNDSINLVKEEDARRRGPSQGKGSSYNSFGVAHKGRGVDIRWIQ